MEERLESGHVNVIFLKLLVILEVCALLKNKLSKNNSYLPLHFNTVDSNYTR